MNKTYISECWSEQLQLTYLSERGFNTNKRERVRLGDYLWSRVPLNNTLKHEGVSFFDGVDPLTDVIIIDITRCA